jgi:hypothetical protein
MHDALGHGQGAAADIDYYQQLAPGVHHRPYPVRRTLQTLDRLIIADLTGFERSQDRVQLVELQLFEVQITQEISTKGAELFGRFDQPVQHGIGLDLKDPSCRTDTQALCQTGQDWDDENRSKCPIQTDPIFVPVFQPFDFS